MIAAELLKPLPRVIAWSSFKGGARDNQPIRTMGTWDDLAKVFLTVLPKPRKKDLAEAKKAVPAFSGSIFFEGRTRSQENAESIYLLVFDFDNCIEEPIPGEFHPSGRPKTRKVPIKRPAQAEDVVEKLKARGYDAAVYTTWSHSEALSKFRVVIPLQAPISPAYWVQATEWAMEHLGFGEFRDARAIDIPVLRDVARLNFLPCAPDPSKVQTWVLQGRHLTIPEAALPTLEVKELPKPVWQASRPTKDERSGREWWKSYRIDFKTLNLEDLMRSMGVKVGGAQPWNGGFKWRCHCPWSSEHTHGLDDDCCVIIQTHGHWPSFKCAHSHHAGLGLRELCEQAGKPLVESHGRSYRPEKVLEREPQDGDHEPLPSAAGNEEQIPVWNRLAKTKDGGIFKTPGNLSKILRFDPEWGSHLSLNEMSQEVMLDEVPVREVFVDRIQEWIEDQYGLAFGRELIQAKVLAQASENVIHPVRRYLTSLPAWDGVERFQFILDEILHAEPHPLNIQYLRRWGVAAVRRVMTPGIKVDNILNLVSPQGFQKSSFFSVLGGDWFNDSPIDIESKDGLQVLHRAWIHEMAEIDGITKKKDYERMKSFLSSRKDIFRPPYASTVGVFPRSCVIVGSANENNFLVDPTGSRRFWIMKITKPIETGKMIDLRDQFWAECMNLHQAGIPHWLESGMETIRDDRAQDFEAEDPWLEMLQALLPEIRAKAFMGTEGVSVNEILEVMEIPAYQRNRSAATKLGPLLRKCGWEKQAVGTARVRRWFPT